LSGVAATGYVGQNSFIIDCNVFPVGAAAVGYVGSPIVWGISPLVPATWGDQANGEGNWEPQSVTSETWVEQESGAGTWSTQTVPGETWTEIN
jgi:hypothetical protein